MSANTTWPNSGGLKNTVNEDVRISRNCAPHLIYGTLRLNDSNIQESEISFNAFNINKPEEKLNQQAAGCLIKDGYWVVQCHSFPSGWEAGETIKLVFTNKDNIQLDEVDVILTNEPADAAKEIKINKTSTGYLLSQNSPNPFSDYTLIQYQIPEDGRVEVDVFSLNGEKIRTLVSESKTAGNYEAIWNGKDDHGNKLSSGMYVYMLKSSKTILMKKSILLK
jgi:predicted RNase H-like HicB family nuclease